MVQFSWRGGGEGREDSTTNGGQSYVGIGLTESEDAEDDGLRNEVDCVSGASEVELALAVLLVLVHKLLSNLQRNRFQEPSMELSSHASYI